MSKLALFDGVLRPAARRSLEPGACPLCGARMRVPLGLHDAALHHPSTCRLGVCVADPQPGTTEHTLLALNREVLRGELLEVEFAIAAIAAAKDLARSRGRAFDTYLEESFALAIRRRVLRSYVEPVGHAAD